MSGAVRYALGLDLGLRTGWCIWDHQQGRLVEHGSIDVRKLEGEGHRMSAWADGLSAVSDVEVFDAVGYEEVRHMKGQGARYILMQQGVLLSWCYSAGLLCAGIPVPSLKAYARRYRLADHEVPPALRNAADMQFWLAAHHGESMAHGLSEDEVMATWVALWLGSVVEHG